MISKELLSEVLECNIYEILPESEIIGSPKVIQYRTKNSFMPFDYINIYELAHKCKEWAFNKGGIDITSGKRLGLDGWECLVFIGVIPCDCYEADTEPEAIFKACQWILENK